MFDEVKESLKNLRKEIVSLPELEESAREIDGIIENADSPLLIMVMGEFSTGKSTFINALVGKEIAVTDAKPTTAVITKLCYGTEDRITVFFRDGSKENCSEESFAALTSETENMAELRENIDYVERALPFPMLRSMTIIDSPGLNSLKAVHEGTTRRFMDKADTVLWMFSAEKPASQTEFDALKRLNPRLEPIAIVNKIDTINEDEGDTPEKVLAEVEKKLRNNRLEVQGVLGISAKMAFQGRKNGNEKLVEASRIGDFDKAVEEVVLPRREQYKRNSLLDGLARVVFRVGSVLTDARTENEARRDTDYTKYIETETSLAAAIDELEAIAAGFVGELEGQRSSLLGAKQKIKLNAAEKAFLGALYWLGLGVEKDDKLAQQYLEEAAVRNDSVAQESLAEVYGRLGQESKSKYWRERLGGSEKLENAIKIEERTIIAENGVTDENADEIYNKAVDFYAKYEYDHALNLFSKAATVGNADAMFYIGNMYREGHGVMQDYAEAKEWYRKSAEAGNKYAMFNIGNMYYEGHGVTQDYAEAMEWYRKSAEAGNTYAMFNIGIMYYGGHDVTQDYAEAMEWFRKAAETGDANAMFNIGIMYYGGHGVTQDYAEAMEWFRKAAETGNANAMFNIGNMYYEGRGVMQDYDEAMKWFRKAAEAGNADAMFNIGIMYYEGHGVTQDYAEAMEWYRKSAEAGNANAMFNIGNMYYEGRGVTQDYAEAMKWFRKAADNGVSDAMNSICAMYTMGEGVTQDYNEAMKWLQRAAKVGNVIAIANIGVMYAEGYGVAVDYDEAMKWFRRAAEMGFAYAMHKIGEIYEEGHSVPKDYDEALKWYRKAAEAGDEEATEIIKELKEKMAQGE